MKTKMRRRNFFVLGFGIPVSLLTVGAGVMSFVIILALALGFAFSGNSPVIIDVALYTSFILMASGVISLIGSIISGFFSIPGGIILLISSILSLINPVVLIITMAIHSNSFPILIVLLVLPAILLWILGIWSLCTKPKTVEPKIKINNNNNINLTVVNNIPPQQSQLNEQPQQNENTQQNEQPQQNESNTEED